MSKETETKIKKILDEQIRPVIQMDGGDVEFKEYKDGIVYVSLKGACQGCPGATMTIKMGIETRLKQEIPEIKQVVQI
ncbi:NifU family protein [bacterium]|jgi:Fe-S cluster biogenesis protein NfuA|nr:NifU family protein [bacterium]MBT3581124.1 NifU family protein [bacterium]MBT4552585.1 NifU family protein [bacterium]MBT5988457.1 NifU family protein [bacterium]MBT7088627.1 NifU family protein [bacterium]